MSFAAKMLKWVLSRWLKHCTAAAFPARFRTPAPSGLLGPCTGTQLCGPRVASERDIRERAARPGPLLTRWDCAAQLVLSILSPRTTPVCTTVVLRVCQLCSWRPLVLANPIKRALVSSSAQACAVSTTSTLPAAARVGRFANATRRKNLVRHEMTLLHVLMATKNPLQSIRNARRATNDLLTRAGSRCWYKPHRWAADVTFDGAGVMTVASRHYVCRRQVSEDMMGGLCASGARVAAGRRATHPARASRIYTSPS